MKKTYGQLKISFKGFNLILMLLLGGMLILVGCTSPNIIPVTLTADPKPGDQGSTAAPAEEAPRNTPDTLLTPYIPTSSLPPNPPVKEFEMTTVEPGLEPLIQQAIDDLAKRLDVGVENIKVLQTESITWPDSSLGCPQPGMAYLQVPEDGALIVLKVDSTLYEYHNGGNRGLFLCEKNMKDPNPAPHLDIFNLTPSKSNPSTTPPTPENSIPPGEGD
jgi:hypothetical protein